MLRSALAVMLVLAGVSLLLAQDDAPVQSGPKVGVLLPKAASFDCFNVNGKAKGRPHCLVCEFDRAPVVLIFAREPAEGKSPGLDELLKKLDDAMDKYQEKELKGGIVFLSPDARSSASDSSTDDPTKLVEEAKLRAALLERLAARADKLKNIIVATYPVPSDKELEENPKLPYGPKGFDLSPKAEVTVLFYYRMKVLLNAAFAEGKLTEPAADAFLEKAQEHLAPKARKKS